MPWMMSERHCIWKGQHKRKCCMEDAVGRKCRGRVQQPEHVVHGGTERALQGPPLPHTALWSKPCDSFPAKTKQLPGSVMVVPGLRAMLLLGNWQLCMWLTGRKKNVEERKNR